MIAWFRTNRQLRSEVTYLQSRVKAAAERPVLKVKPGPPPGPAIDAGPARTDDLPVVRTLRSQIAALERMKTTPGAAELVRDARTWQERAERLADLEAANRRQIEDQEREILRLRATQAGSVPGPRQPGLG
ncbi:hypothetical protein [Streptomyces goshikiensis]